MQFLHQMFNVSSLPLDDALKPLTNGAINETLRQFPPLSDISQGSVATHLRYGGIFSDGIVTNFLLILPVNNFENRLIFDEVKVYKTGGKFLGHPVFGAENSKNTEKIQISCLYEHVTYLFYDGSVILLEHAKISNVQRSILFQYNYNVLYVSGYISHFDRITIMNVLKFYTLHALSLCTTVQPYAWITGSLAHSEQKRS